MNKVHKPSYSEFQSIFQHIIILVSEFVQTMLYLFGEKSFVYQKVILSRLINNANYITLVMKLPLCLIFLELWLSG
jgi:hypothetical protein